MPINLIRRPHNGDCFPVQTKACYLTGLDVGRETALVVNAFDDLYTALQGAPAATAGKRGTGSEELVDILNGLTKLEKLSDDAIGCGMAKLDYGEFTQLVERTMDRVRDMHPRVASRILREDGIAMMRRLMSLQLEDWGPSAWPGGERASYVGESPFSEEFGRHRYLEEAEGETRDIGPSTDRTGHGTGAADVWRAEMDEDGD